MTFDELFSNHNITLQEREMLVMYLVMLRSKEIINVLLSAHNRRCYEQC